MHMGHGAPMHPNLEKKTSPSSPNRKPLAGAPIAKRSTSFGAQISMRSTDAPLQMWRTYVFFVKRILVNKGHGEPE